jgi:hypothetical protein
VGFAAGKVQLSAMGRETDSARRAFECFKAKEGWVKGICGAEGGISSGCRHRSTSYPGPFGGPNILTCDFVPIGGQRGFEMRRIPLARVAAFRPFPQFLAAGGSDVERHLISMGISPESQTFGALCSQEGACPGWIPGTLRTVCCRHAGMPCAGSPNCFPAGCLIRTDLLDGSQEYDSTN